MTKQPFTVFNVFSNYQKIDINNYNHTVIITPNQYILNNDDLINVFSNYIDDLDNPTKNLYKTTVNLNELHEFLNLFQKTYKNDNNFLLNYTYEFIDCPHVIVQIKHNFNDFIDFMKNNY